MNLAKFISRLFIATILLFFAVSTFLQLFSEYRNFKARSQERHSQYIGQQKNLVRDEVRRVIHSIQYERQQTDLLLREKITERVNDAHNIASSIYKRYHTIYARPVVENIIKDALRDIRFSGGRTYYYIMSRTGTEVLNPVFHHLEGSNLLKSDDAQIRAAVQRTLTYFDTSDRSDGYFENKWFKPNADTTQKYTAVSYVKSFKPYNWLIGTSEYLDEIRGQIQNSLLNELAAYRFDDDGYIFINRYNGQALLSNGKRNNRPAYLWDLGGEPARAVFEMELNAAQKNEGDFIYYSWRKLKSDSLTPKVSFIHGIPEWQWMVGAGVYLDTIERQIAASQDQLFSKFKTDITRNVFVLLLALLLFTLFRFWIMRQVGSEFTSFFNYFRLAAEQNSVIPTREIRYQELQFLSENVNTILQDKLAASRDLSKEKEYLAVTLNSITDGVIAADITGQITSINQAAEDMISCRQDKKLPTTLPELFPFIAEDFEKVKSNSNVIVLENSLEPQEYICPEGRTLLLEYSVAPLRDSADRTKGIVVVFRDISSRVQAEENTLKIRKLESVGVLAGGIAHDFNNLLAGIFGNVSLAKHYLKPTDQAFRYIDSAEQSIDRATALTKQLLTFAKGGDPVKEAVDMAEFVQQVADFNLRGSNVKAEYDFESDLFTTRVDKGQFSQVIANLVINARQAMPEGGSMHIGLHNYWHKRRAFKDPFPQLELVIEDFGSGIPEKYLSRIFDPYFTTKQQGNGLGLSMVYSIIKKHNGFIDVASRPNQGTRFTIYIPAEAQTKETQQQAPESIEKQSRPLSGQVLLLDDEPAVLQIGTAILESMGLKVTTATEGALAIKLFKDALDGGEAFDLVIVDLTIPGGIGGLKVVEEILRIEAEAKVIVSSGYSTDPAMANFEKYGFAGRIEKPYLLKSIKKEVTRVLSA